MLLVLDGLGWNAVAGARRRSCPSSPRWRAARSRPSCPSTTATALTSITTGLAPAQHGIVGYRMLVGGDVLNVLRWTVPGGGRPPDPFDVQRHTAFLGRAGPGRDRTEFRDTGFTQAHLRGGRFVGWHTTAGARRALRARDRGGRAVRVRVLPGRRHDRARVRLARRVSTRASSRPPTRSSASCSTRSRATPRCSSPPITARCISNRESWIEIPELARDDAPRWPATVASATCYARKGAARELLAAAREQLGDARVGVVARRAARRGAARHGRDRQRSPAASATSCSRRASRSRSSIPRCRTRRSCAPATAPSRPTRCSCPSSPPRRPRLTRLGAPTASLWRGSAYGA